MDITGSDVQPLFGDLDDRPMERVSVADPELTYKKTGWKPWTSLDEGLTRTIGWYKKHLKEFIN